MFIEKNLSLQHGNERFFVCSLATFAPESFLTKMPSFPARLFSIAGHPLLVLSYLLLLMMSTNPFAFGVNQMSDQRAVVLIFYVVSTTFLIPALGVSLLKPLGLIKSLAMTDKQERIGPYIITGVFYLWMFKNFSTGSVPPLFAEFALGATIALFLAFFANIFLQISAHTTGMGALLTMVAILAFEWAGQSLHIGSLAVSFNVVLIFVTLLAGLVGVSRLSLKDHPPGAIYLGYAAGILAVLSAHIIL
ncbi:MAG: hypothetical protein IT261_05965 [Saprospiraceae bacterium]|nr:hypothetical protein [Saprospiraceae bacterium]